MLSSNCFKYYGGIVLLFLLCAACSRGEVPVEPATSGSVSVQLGFRIGDKTSSSEVKGAVTDMTDINQEAWGIGDIRMLAFSTLGKVGDDATALSLSYSLPSLQKASLIGPDHAHLYSSADVSVPLRTASVLVYGKAFPMSVPLDKHVDGSLVESGFSGRETSALSFSPDPIYNDTRTPYEASVLRSVLNAIGFGDPYSTVCYYYEGETLTQAQVSLNWNASIADPDLLLLYRYFYNDGDLMTMAGDKLEARLNTLYANLVAYESTNTLQYSVSINGVSHPAYNADATPFQYKQLYNGLRDKVLERFSSNAYLQVSAVGEVSFNSGELRAYPESLGLPSGAAAVRWTPTDFVIPVGEGVDGIPSLDSYCYPPALYYYVNSTIHTSDKDMSQYYTEQNQWNVIRGKYELGTIVSNNATAVVVDLPLQYAVGKLKATVKAASEVLLDSEGNSVAVGSGSSFPVTGIIIGKQYPQAYDFSPDASAAEHFLFDRNISGVNLSMAVSEPIHTLVLPTPENEPVYFCVELQNNSGSLFYGAEGRIFPGQKFYLTGKLDIQEDRKEDFPSVFMSDFETSISCVVPSLEWAHSVVPDLSLPILSIGVQTQVNWIVSTGTSVVLD